MSWPDSADGDVPAAERCVLAAPQHVFGVPWEDAVHPHSGCRPGTGPEDALQASPEPSGDAGVQIGAEEESEDVDLTEMALPRFSPQKGSLTQSISMRNRAARAGRRAPPTDRVPAAQEKDKQETLLVPPAPTAASSVANTAERRKRKRKRKGDGDRPRWEEEEEVHQVGSFGPHADKDEMAMATQREREEGRDRGQDDKRGDEERRDEEGRDEERRSDKRQSEERREEDQRDDTWRDQERRDHKQRHDEEGRDEDRRDDKRRDVDRQDEDRRDDTCRHEEQRDDRGRDEGRCDEEGRDEDQKDDTWRDEDRRDAKRRSEERRDVDRRDEDRRDDTGPDEKRWDEEQREERGRDEGRRDEEGQDEDQKDENGRYEEQRGVGQQDEEPKDDTWRDQEGRDSKQRDEEHLEDEGQDEDRMDGKGRYEEQRDEDQRDDTGRDEYKDRRDDIWQDEERRDYKQDDEEGRDEDQRDDKRRSEEQRDLAQQDEDPKDNTWRDEEGRDGKRRDGERLEDEGQDEDRMDDNRRYEAQRDVDRRDEERHDNRGQDEDEDRRHDRRTYEEQRDEDGRDEGRRDDEGVSQLQPQQEIEARSQTGSRKDDGGTKQLMKGGQEEEPRTADSYSEETPPPHTHKLPQHRHYDKSYFEKHTEQMHTEDSYSEKVPEKIENGGFYSEKPAEPIHNRDSYFEKHTQQTHTEDSYSEKFPVEIHTHGSYSEKPAEEMHNRDSYFEKHTHQIHTEDSYSEKVPEQIENEDSYSEKLPECRHNHTHTKFEEEIHTEDFYFGKPREQRHTDYSEKVPEQIDKEDSYCEKMTPPHTRTQYSEKPAEQRHSEDSYFEKLSEQLHNEDPYCQMSMSYTHSRGSYFEKVPEQIHAEDSYFEKLPLQIENEDSQNHTDTKFEEERHTEDSYFESLPEQIHTTGYSCPNLTIAHTEDSCCEKPMQQMYTPESCSEKFSEQIHTDASYCEKLPEQIDKEGSYCEKMRPPHTRTQYSICVEKPTEHIHAEDSYFEKLSEQMHNEDFYCEKMIHLYTMDSPTEKFPELICTDESYCEKLPEQIDEDSYFEKLTPPHLCSQSSCSEKCHPQQMEPSDSYCEMLQIHTEDSFSDSSSVECTRGVSSYFESSLAANSVAVDNSYCERPTDNSSCETLPQQIDDSSSESCANRGPADDSYFDDSLSYCEKDVARSSAVDSYCEKLPERVDVEKPSCRELTRPREGECQQADSSHLGLVSFRSDFSKMLLRSGVVALPGSCDRSGRSLLTVDAGAHAVWSHPECLPGELLRLMLYYVSTLSADSPGVTVLVDGRRAMPAPALLSALEAVQEEVPGRVGRALLLTDANVGEHAEQRACVKMLAGTQVEALSSLSSLVDEDQLPREFGGSLRFSHSDRLAFRYRVEQLSSQCDDVIKLLQKNIDIMEDIRLPDTQQDAERQLCTYQELMRGVLGDSRLVRLQREGGARLSQLRRDQERDRDGGGPRRTALAAVCRSYERVDELLHRLVAVNNERTRHLRLVRDFCRAACAFRQVSSWMEGEGQTQLRCLDQSEDSLEALGRKQRDFQLFYSAACARCKEAESSLRRLERWREAWPGDAAAYRAQVGPLRDQLDRFWQGVATVGRNVRKRLALYRFLDRAYGWAIEGRHRLAAMTVKADMSPEECAAATASLEEHGRRRPPVPEAAFREMTSLAGELRDERAARQLSFARAACRETLATFDGKMADARLAAERARRRRRLSSASTETLPGAGPRRAPLLRRLFGGEPARPRLHSCSVSAPASFPRPLRKTQSFDGPAPEAGRSGPAAARALSEPARRGNTGVFIRGLEVSGAAAAERALGPGTPSPAWAGGRGPGTPAGESLAAAEGPGDGRKLRRIVEEMVTTEREYVRSLRYVMEHYVPEMERADLPQDLRGKRSVVFGNLEKLLDFHAHVFLKELEACWKHPLRVAQCFLRHREQFSLYALYSKNKPESDALLASHGLAFFKRKQRELDDKMDLCSYLLKPVQRMSKYALLLDDLIKEAGVGREAELTSLRTAAAAVRFQLRRGNDLLAMDAIRHCDVNLKEQGRLLRQDRFTVWSGRRKCERRVFLFEQLLLLSKAKKVDGGLDVFQYKRSFKTSDLGLTESAGDDGLRFEVWFRRRTSKNQTLTLQADSAHVKDAWTRQLAAILWTQAARNKGARTRASIAVSASDRADPFLRAAATSDPSSAGLLGSLDLHVFRYRPPGGDVAPPRVDEDERERDTACSQPSVTTDSSGSSSRCQSGSTGSDSGCVSSRPQDPSSASSGSSHKAGAEPATDV
ncbi:uncharacterized protein plekhg4 isoform X2 [Festucalex cinctus]